MRLQNNSSEGKWKLSEEEGQKCEKWKDVVRDFGVDETGET